MCLHSHATRAVHTCAHHPSANSRSPGCHAGGRRQARPGAFSRVCSAPALRLRAGGGGPAVHPARVVALRQSAPTAGTAGSTSAARQLLRQLLVPMTAGGRSGAKHVTDLASQTPCGSAARRLLAPAAPSPREGGQVTHINAACSRSTHGCRLMRMLVVHGPTNITARHAYPCKSVRLASLAGVSFFPGTLRAQRRGFFPWDALCPRMHALAMKLWTTPTGLFTSTLNKVGVI